MTDDFYDVCVIGGGIHGAGVAQAAAARGHSVLVLEKTALAAGTSSRSSKLIHGGLRYLESAQIALVRESLRERAILLQIAPDLVKLQPFTIPVYGNTSRRPWQFRTGLSLYALLGGLGQVNRFSKVPKSKWDQLDGLSTNDLNAVYRYWDAQTDDTLLTQAVMQSARQMGADLLMPARFVQAKVDGQGVEVTFEKNGAQQGCRAAVLVNAAGPWICEVAGKIAANYQLPPIELVQGSHLVVQGELTGGIYYLEAPQDSRAVFVMPWKGNMLIGTTETTVNDNPDTVQPLQQEEEYLLAVLRHYFPRVGQEQNVVLSSFAGLRVLPGGAGGAFNKSRETILAVDNDSSPRLLTIVGGKLTVYRATAEKVMQRLAVTLPSPRIQADTKTLALSLP